MTASEAVRTALSIMGEHDHMEVIISARRWTIIIADVGDGRYEIIDDNMIGRDSWYADDIDGEMDEGTLTIRWSDSRSSTSGELLPLDLRQVVSVDVHMPITAVMP